MGEAFGRYTLVKRLGAGGMGEVFLARANGSTEDIVLKRILPHLTENPRFLRLFLDETRIASRLVHPNIARIYELGEVDGTWFVAMELVAGKDLRELLKRAREQGHHVPLEVALGVGVEIARGLSHAHGATDAQGRLLHVVHRDVSPHNILIGRNGEVKLIDFGVAKAANKSVQTGTGILKGKFPYMAPEQAHAKPVDPRTDVFALGIVLWEMVCAKYLFRGKTDAVTLKLVREAQVPLPSSLRDDVPEAVDRVLMKALKKEPRDRYPTAEAFREALSTVLAGLPPPDIAKWLVDYDDVPGLDSSGESFVSEPPSAEATQLESHEKETVAESPSRASNHVRPRPGREPSDRKDGSDEKALSQLKEILTQVAGRPTNIGPQATTFVGRVAELADLHQLFRQGARLLTLLGPGGTGKTRLSLQFGSQLVTHFQSVNEKGRRRGGVWFCDLTEAADRDGVCAAVARALGVPLMPTEPVKQLGHAILARGETLIVLDNFEQVVGAAAATIGAWLAVAPQARFVVTSRELLRVADETVFEVPPLRMPREARDARSAEAVELFIERSRAARPGWQPTDPELAAIAEIVKQLDGMPLAIELAASRMSVLSPSQLVQRLPRRFDVLVDRKAVDRQATLRGAIDWSWNNLSPAETSTLAQLSVFRGGLSAEAVEEVVALTGAPEGTALEALMTLRSKSLVRAYFPSGDEGQTRFGLYESIREYAKEKLQARPEHDGALARHSAYFLKLGAKLSAAAESGKTYLDELDLERENLNAVFQRALEVRQPAVALSAVLHLDPLLTMRGPFGVHLQMLDAIIDKLEERGPRAAALETRARARLARGRASDAEADLLEAEELATDCGDKGALGRIMLIRAMVDRQKGQRGESKQRFERALELLKDVGDLRMEGRAVSNIGTLQQELGEGGVALETYNRALEIHRAARDRRYEGITLANLGVLQQALGLLKAARANYQAALSIHRELGSRRSEGISHINLGDLAAELEQPGQALSHYESALEILRDVGARRFEGATLLMLASLHLQYGEYDDTMRRVPEAIDVLREVGDLRYLGLALGVRAATVALLGELEAAEEDMAEATRLLTEVGDLSFLDALDLYRAHLELGHALRTGSEHQAAVLDERILKRIAHVEKPGPAADAHPTGTPSAADRSEHVRAALRSLRGALEDNGRQG